MRAAGRDVAELIAPVVADIRAGRVNPFNAGDLTGIRIHRQQLKLAQLPQPVVNVTPIFDAQRREEQVNLYDDYPSITPPWEDALLCFVNTHGNVMVMQVHRTEWNGSDHEPWPTEDPVDWWRVRWEARTTIWVGGGSADGLPLPTTGPVHMFRHAVYGDGTPADIGWVALAQRRSPLADRLSIKDPNSDTWDASLITVNASLNFLNARNVDVAEPARPRPVRRRIADTGVEVQEIVVRPPGKHRPGRGRPGEARPISADEAVVNPRRGSFGHYGPTYKRGLLFGKLAGKFWRPAVVPGAKKAGREPAVKDYVLVPASSAPAEPGEE